MLHEIIIPSIKWHDGPTTLYADLETNRIFVEYENQKLIINDNGFSKIIDEIDLQNFNCDYNLYIFFFIRMPLATTYHVLYEDKDDCEILMKMVYETSPTIRTGDGIGSWTGTADGMEQSTTPFYVEDNVNVIVLYFVFPISIILGIYFKDKRK